jgi:multicomponent Na+:H+ antiporter subunit E
MRRFQIAIPIFLVYLALSGNLEPANLVLGALVALLVSVLLPVPAGPAYPWRRLPLFVWAMMRYFLVVITDIIKGAIATSRIVLDPKLPINPGIIIIPSDSKSELGAALSAHAISLSPGELVVEMDTLGTLYVHCLNVDNSAQYASEAQTLRRELLSAMFE